MRARPATRGTSEVPRVAALSAEAFRLANAATDIYLAVAVLSVHEFTGRSAHH